MKKALLFTLCTFAVAASHAAPAVERDGLLADAKGMTLYTFKKDARLQSNCYDGCAKAWPPFVVADATKAYAHFAVITRKDGVQQWAFKGQPLYYYGGDSSPGDVTGDGSGKTWYVIRSSKPASGGYNY